MFPKVNLWTHKTLKEIKYHSLLINLQSFNEFSKQKNLERTSITMTSKVFKLK